MDNVKVTTSFACHGSCDTAKDSCWALHSSITYYNDVGTYFVSFPDEHFARLPLNTFRGDF